VELAPAIPEHHRRGTAVAAVAAPATYNLHSEETDHWEEAVLRTEVAESVVDYHTVGADDMPHSAGVARS